MFAQDIKWTPLWTCCCRLQQRSCQPTPQRTSTRSRSTGSPRHCGISVHRVYNISTMISWTSRWTSTCTLQLSSNGQFQVVPPAHCGLGEVRGGGATFLNEGPNRSVSTFLKKQKQKVGLSQHHCVDMFDWIRSLFRWNAICWTCHGLGDNEYNYWHTCLCLPYLLMCNWKIFSFSMLFLNKWTKSFWIV